MNWVEVFAVLIVCHLLGDFLLQTDWQAAHKYAGLGPDPVRRRALLSHTLVYTLSFLPALIWIGLEVDALRAIVVAVIVFLPHYLQDDGRALDAYMVRVKGLSTNSPGLRIAVDQSFHMITLFGTALLATA